MYTHTNASEIVHKCIVYESSESNCWIDEWISFIINYSYKLSKLNSSRKTKTNISRGKNRFFWFAIKYLNLLS